MTFDVAVIGLGAMGSSALAHLAERGLHAVGFDSHSPPHTLGSTHGYTRIIREAYYEHPAYVPLVRRAYRNWFSLEEKSGQKLFTETGAVMIGREDSELVRGTIASAREHEISVEQLDVQQLRARFPAFAPESNSIGIYEPRAGLLRPEACVSAYLGVAAAAGARIHRDSAVTSVERRRDDYELRVGDNTFHAHRLIVSAGAWANDLLAPLGLALPLSVERQSMHWIESSEDSPLLRPGKFPVAMMELANERLFYATPDIGEGVKAALHHEGAVVASAAEVQREVTSDDTSRVESLVRQYIPGAAGPVRQSVTCLYTNTPDRHFVVDLADDGRIVRLSACSGHGFKFASVLGELAADMAAGATPSEDPGFFSGGRFGVARAPHP